MTPNAKTDPTPARPDALEFAPNLSAFDRALIRALQEDGRRSFASIARELDQTESRVRQRVQQLCDGGVMRITTIAQPETLGYRTLALVGVTVDPRHGVAEVAGRLAALPGVFYVPVVTGHYNVLVEISAVDNRQLLHFLNDELGAVPGVTSFEVHPYLRLHYQNPAFEAARHKGAEKSETGHAPRAIDAIDRAIIRHLQVDGRTPYQSIARNLSISESQVRQRVKRLTTENLLRVMALTIPNGLGFTTMALLGVKLEHNVSAEKLVSLLAEMPAVIYVAMCVGRFDLFVEVACIGHEDLLRLLEDHIRPLTGIDHVEAWTYLDLHYRSVEPAPVAD